MLQFEPLQFGHITPAGFRSAGTSIRGILQHAVHAPHSRPGASSGELFDIVVGS
jgi:hypothetical protein